VDQKLEKKIVFRVWVLIYVILSKQSGKREKKKQK